MLIPFFVEYRIRMTNSPVSDPAGLWKSGCSSAKAALTYSRAQSLKTVMTGQQDHWHIPIWKRCQLSFLDTASQLDNSLSPPLLTLSISKEGSFKPTT